MHRQTAARSLDSIGGVVTDALDDAVLRTGDFVGTDC
jgi:hypothetical protein